MSATLTTANSSIAITVEALYPTPVLLSGYSADNVFDTQPVENAEFSMGIDGKLSAGFVYNPVPFTLTLQADSPSLPIFENIWQYESSGRDKPTIGITVALPSADQRVTYKKGFMRSYKAPAAGRLLQPAVVEFWFERQEFSRT